VRICGLLLQTTTPLKRSRDEASKLLGEKMLQVGGRLTSSSICGGDLTSGFVMCRAGRCWALAAPSRTATRH
jgi:hypothetical protein